MNTHKQILKILNKVINQDDFQGKNLLENAYLVSSSYEIIAKFDFETGILPLEKDMHKDILTVLRNSFSESIRIYPINKAYVYILPIRLNADIEYYLVTPYKSLKLGFEQAQSLFVELLRVRIKSYRNIESDFLASNIQRQLCSNFSDGYMTLNSEGKIMYMNEAGCTMLKVMESQIVGSFIGEILEFSFDLLSPLELNHPFVAKEISVTTQNEKIIVIGSGTPLKSEYGEKIGVLVTFNEIKRLRKHINQLVGANAVFQFDDIQYKSGRMENLIRMAKVSAEHDSNILIVGESGTGKEMIAQSIHNHSFRKSGPFITIDCSSIPRELIESELFGYLEGSFTGAKKGGRMGKFELANGGTIFLDEIGEMPYDMQVRLLRVIQNRSVTRIGSNEPIPIDIRIIAATNRNLEEEIEKRNFRLDLFYRLNVIQLSVPSLKDRKEDILLLIRTFIEKAARRSNKKIPSISEDAIFLLQEYTWPGNVRELENIMERAVILSENEIETSHLPEKLYKTTLEPRGVEREEFNVIEFKSLKEIETEVIKRMIELCKGNITLAAKKLDISRTTLYNKLRAIERIKLS